MATKYTYTTLNEIVAGDNNFYGIIIDANFPTMDSNPEHYVCHVKLIDPDVNNLSPLAPDGDTFWNIIIKSSVREQLPYIHKLGDVMRIHRGVYSEKHKKCIYVNLSNDGKKSSWCIFNDETPSQEGRPTYCSSDFYSLEEQDREQVEDMKAYAKSYLSKKDSLLYPYELKLKDRYNSPSTDNDLLLKVAGKKELPDKIVFFVLDETDACELHTFRYFNYINNGDVIRLRSFKLYESNDNVILMNKFSNILVVPTYFDYFKNFLAEIARTLQPSSNVPLYDDSNKDDIIMQYDNENIRNANYGVEIDLPEPESSTTTIKINYPKKNLHGLSDKDTKFMLDLNVVDISPQSIADFVLVFCTKCLASFNLKEYGPEQTTATFYPCKNCADKSVPCRLYYNVRLVCRENAHSTKLIMLHLSTYDNEGSNFLGIEPADFSKNVKDLDRLKNVVDKLVDQNCRVSVLIEAIGTSESHKVYRIIGNYKNHLLA